MQERFMSAYRGKHNWEDLNAQDQEKSSLVAGYLFMESAASAIEDDDIDNWNDAYSWGDHAQEGYLTNVDGSETKIEAGTSITISGSGTTASP